VTCFEMGKEEVESRIVVDCYELERYLQKRSLAAADSTMMRKKTKGIFGNRWVKKMLGQVRSELDQVLVGLVLKPKCMRYRAGLRALGLATGLDQGLTTRSGSVRISGWISLQNPV
jgi:hypothetical protein